MPFESIGSIMPKYEPDEPVAPENEIQPPKKDTYPYPSTPPEYRLIPVDPTIFKNYEQVTPAVAANPFSQNQVIPELDTRPPSDEMFRPKPVLRQEAVPVQKPRARQYLQNNNPGVQIKPSRPAEAARPIAAVRPVEAAAPRQVPEAVRAPTTSEKLKPEFWEAIYNRIDHQKIIDGLVNIGTLENPADPVDKLNREKHYEALMEFATSAKALANSARFKMDNDTFVRHFMTVTNKQFNLDQLTTQGYLLPPTYKKQPEAEPETQDALVITLDGNLERITKSHEKYKQIKRDIWHNPVDTWPPYLTRLKEYLIDEGTIDDLSVSTLNNVISMIPGIEDHLVNLDAIPDMAAEREFQNELHQLAKTEEFESPQYAVNVGNPPAGETSIIDSYQVDRILDQTIPSYFLDNHLKSITFTTEQQRAKLPNGKEYQMTSRLAVTPDKDGRPETYNLTINGNWSINEGAPSGQANADRTEKAQLIYDRIVFQSAHIIAEQLALPELMAWSNIYDKEIAPKANTITQAIDKERKPRQADLFASIYLKYIKDPDATEKEYPNASRFIAKIIHDYSSPAQLEVILKARVKRRNVTRADKIQNTIRSS